MSRYGSELERAVLEALIPSLEAKGYQVFIQPSRSILPPFMEGYRPDAVALKQGDNIAIEVSSPVRASDEKLLNLKARFQGQKDWSFQIYYAPPQHVEPSIKAPAKGNVLDIVDAASSLMDEAGGIPSLLTAWAAFEGASRLLLPDQLLRAQTPGRLVETLASQGYVTPDEADVLRRCAQLRNRVAHGDFNASLDRGDVTKLISIIKDLLSNDENGRA